MIPMRCDHPAHPVRGPARRAAAVRPRAGGQGAVRGRVAAVPVTVTRARARQIPTARAML